MKKLFLGIAMLGVALIGFNSTASAQNYRTAGGLFIDFGDGTTFVGPAVKHSLDGTNALQGMVLFGSGATAIGAEYSYNKNIPGASGLGWNIGVGPQAIIGKNNTTFAIRPALGLEYTIPSAPINLGVDWRPLWALSDGSHFTAGRFGLALRYVFSK